MPTGSGVWGENSGGGVGVSGTSTNGTAVKGVSTSENGGMGQTKGGIGVYGQSTGSGKAGKFDGDVEIDGAAAITGDATLKVTATIDGKITMKGDAEIGGKSTLKSDAEIDGNVNIKGDITSVNTVTVQSDVKLVGADCAEQFDIRDAATPEPGTIVVIDEGGMLRESSMVYGRRVAGVVSGAGEYRSALVLRQRPSPERRVPVALVGKVYCKVDADPAPIGVGDPADHVGTSRIRDEGDRFRASLWRRDRKGPAAACRGPGHDPHPGCFAVGSPWTGRSRTLRFNT
jgi:hypothetical protein